MKGADSAVYLQTYLVHPKYIFIWKLHWNRHHQTLEYFCWIYKIKHNGHMFGRIETREEGSRVFVAFYNS